jgi:beta-alanine degradation protein BauB
LRAWSRRRENPDDLMFWRLSPPDRMPYRVRRRLLIAVMALGLCAGAAQAQNSKPDNPDAPKVLLENEQVRVLEVRFKAGGKADILNHPNRFIYALSDGALLFSPPGKTPYELSFKTGEALWLPAQQIATRNEGDKDVRALVVELKEVSRGRGKRAAAKDAPRAAGKKSSKQAR